MTDFDIVCSFFKFGYCKHGETCRKLHLQELCENDVCENIQSCKKRHPVDCRYMDDVNFIHVRTGMQRMRLRRKSMHFKRNLKVVCIINTKDA